MCVVCADGLDVMRFCRFLFIGPRERASEEAGRGPGALQ